ncbi:MAG: FecR family protein [Halothiobacillaceae bacterium]
MKRILLLLLVLYQPLSWAQENTPVVGNVVFVIGQSQRKAADGESTPITQGMALHVGDTIETSPSGHVHIRFIDDGFISVRPESRLTVEAYQAHVGDANNTQIRFTLHQGQIRSITGKAAEAAHERFRLNTPLAAIGIKGTDFVTRTDAQTTQVILHSGAVIVSPLDETTCPASGLGACEGHRARLLDESMRGLMLELTPQLDAPRFTPLRGEGPGLIPPPAREEPKPNRPQATASHPLATENERTYLEVKSATLPPPATLVWGRWSAYTRPQDNLTLPYPQAADGRHIMVGDDYYALFRPSMSDGTTRLTTAPDPVSFRLDHAQAYLDRQGNLTPAQIQTSQLTVDFANRQFSTSLTLQHPETGSADLRVGGTINEEGIFVGKTDHGRIAGALTLDGKEAAYLFERPINDGRFTGITHWSH